MVVRAQAESSAAGWALEQPVVDTEAALVERLRANDHAAWQQLWEQQYLPVYRYAHARIFDPAAASDVAADVFVAAVEGICRYRHRGRPLLAWLYGIARHRVADHQRRACRRREVRYPEGDPLAAGLASALQTDDRLDLERAVQCLPEAQREVLTLRYFVGLTTPEIAAVLGKQPAALYSLQARALLALRKDLSR